MNNFFIVGIAILFSMLAIVGIARLVEKIFERRRYIPSFSIPNETPLVLPDLPSYLPNVRYNENVLFIASAQIELESNIEQAIPLSELIIVLLDPFADPSLYDASNLVGINYSGDEVWRAELPSGYGVKANPSHVRYIKITNIDPLTAYNGSGFSCKIDPLSGKIIESVFTK